MFQGRRFLAIVQGRGYLPLRTTGKLANICLPIPQGCPTEMAALLNQKVRLAAAARTRVSAFVQYSRR